jgi:hypothetical protein
MYKKKRGGMRLPEDRLNGSLLMILVILPVSTIVYGWSVEKEFGGLGLPIAGSFIQGFALMASFSGLNTYAAGELGYREVITATITDGCQSESNPEFKTAVISGKYVIQYTFGAGLVGGTVPMIDAIGAGWSFTLSKHFESTFHF